MVDPQPRTTAIMAIMENVFISVPLFDSTNDRDCHKGTALHVVAGLLT
jgi:hypothetical protein